MKQFKELGIKVSFPGFTGDKIKIDRLLNREITVLDYKIGPSTAKPGTDYLTLQFELNGEKHVTFTSGTKLIDVIKQVDKADFPFKTIIVKENESLQFS